jgi:ATP-GRASP peptide maturase of grasp-with-spasm system
MVLVETISNDYSTFDVIQWFNYYGVKYFCITPDDIVNISISQSNENVILRIGDEIIGLNDITGYWFRRGFFTVKMSKKSPYYRVRDEVCINSYNYSVTEKNVFLHYLHHLLQEKKSLNSFLYSEVNKLVVLYEAKKVGLLIPKHILTESKFELECFVRMCNGNAITKVVAPSGGFETPNLFITTYTEKIDEGYINSLEDIFSPSFFQECIEKEFEIRSFLLNGNFYSMAIFSQESEKTSIDFRNYDTDKPNRRIPYNLPYDIETKLKVLFNSLNLNSGSADLIYSRDGRYHFLEINPVGQFGMVSYPCNYYLEREIALYFKN